MIKMNKRLALLLSTALVLSFGTCSIAQEGTSPIINLDALNLTQTPMNGETNSSDGLPELDSLNSSSTTQTAPAITKESIPTMEKPEPPISINAIEYEPGLYPNPTLGHAKKSYLEANYTGAAQELFSYLEKNPESAEGFYYLAMTLAGLGDPNAAVEAYEKTITLTNDEGFRQLAAKGRDCITGGPLCSIISEVAQEEELDPLDEFIKAPYGDGFSPELQEKMKLEKLDSIKKNINRKPELDPDEVQEIKDFDKEYSGEQDKKSSNDNITGEKLALADVSNEDIVSAINTLRDAGMTVTIQPTVQPAGYQNAQMAEMSMLLGSGQNNNYNDPMNQMLPYMMQAGSPDGSKNINPQVVQAMMMNSMMGNLDFNTYDNK